MNLFVGLAILAVLAIPLAVAIWRSNELFCLEVVGGRMRFVRGRIPQRLLDDLADVLRRPPVSHARLRAVSEDRRPRIVVSSGNVGEGQLQQLRNVLGTWELAKIRAGGKPRRR